MSNADLVAMFRRDHELGLLKGDGCGDFWPCHALQGVHALEAAEAEKAALVADNAALLHRIGHNPFALAAVVGWRSNYERLPGVTTEALSLIDGVIGWIQDLYEATNEDHPGAELLARLKRLEAVAEAAGANWRACVFCEAMGQHSDPDLRSDRCAFHKCIADALEALEARDD